MKEIIISIRNIFFKLIYKGFLKPVFFFLDPEAVHDAMIRLGRVLGSSSFSRKLTTFFLSYSNKKLEQNILGIKFNNPIGLAAGFDKDGLLTNILPSVGFGFAEIGSITGEPCKGNPRPRLWRLKKSKGLVVYYGLMNRGCVEISNRLKNENFIIPIGTNVAKTNNKKTVVTTEGIKDYLKAYSQFSNVGNYFTINISCPNAYGGQPFTSSEKLDKLLTEIDKIPTEKPIFVKLSPDLSKEQIDKIIDICSEHRVNGFICSNVTEERSNNKIFDKNVPKKGGISGKPVEDLANDLISYVYQKTKGRSVIIGCGGVFSAKDAYKKIKLGACLVQLFTGMIFEGPQVISEINQGLVKLLRKDGFKNISQAVGSAN